MKKFLLLTIVAATISTTSFAKTEGDYLSVAVLYNRADFSVNSSTQKTTNGGGMALGYKHAFSFGKVFVAPGVFAENNNLKVALVDGTNVNIKNRYGFKADIGVDLEDDLAIYFVSGVSFLNYSVENSTSKNSGHGRSDFFYGAGISHDYSQNVSFSLEYNTQSFNVKDSTKSTKVKVDNNIVKIGLNYKF